METKVVLKALAEIVVAKDGVEHAHHAASFAVRNGIEDLLYLRRIGDGNLDWMAAAEPIQLQGPLLLLAHVALPNVPLGRERVGSEGLHPICEALIEPQVIPPGHGDEITEPLVGQLVADHTADPLFHAGGHRGLVAKQCHLTVGNQPPVLHGASSEVRDRDHVTLWQREGDAKEIIVELKGLDAALQGIAALSQFSWRSQNSHQCSLLGGRLHKLVLTNAERQQVGGHQGRWEIGHLFAVAWQHLNAGLGHV
mmetsp:Transcript_36497/g.65277  ORF Transcript_36497/g.65277 Transcript_36497/m.65277 type:complete len:253 (+) Transcript_36497:1970-2728(+)